MSKPNSHPSTRPTGLRVSRRPIATAATLACLVLAVAAQVHVNYHDQDFTLQNFETFSATLENQGIAFQGSGKPLNIESKASGLTITGAQANGSAQRGPTQAYFLKDLTVTGNAILNLDTAAAHQYAIAQAAAAGTPKPPASPDNTATKLTTETLHFTGDAANGRADFPNAVVIDSQSSGTRVSAQSTTDFTRILHLTGSSGFITLAVAPANGKNPLKTGELKGPVTFSIHNEDKTAKAAAEVTTIDGKADSLKFDLATQPGTITLSGNVTMNGKGPTATGDINADNVVVTLDANMQPTKVEVTGSPATTRLHQEPPK